VATGNEVAEDVVEMEEEEMVGAGRSSCENETM
jgi:hypothetical protein